MQRFKFYNTSFLLIVVLSLIFATFVILTQEALILIGYYGLSLGLFALVSTLLWLRKSTKYRFDFAVLLVLGYFFIWSLIHYILGGNVEKLAFTQAFQSIILFLGMYFLGRGIDLGNLVLSKIFKVFFFLTSGLILFIGLRYNGFSNLKYFSDIDISYQIMAKLYLIFASSAYFFSMQRSRVPIFLISLGTLWYLESRSEFVVFSFIILFGSKLSFYRVLLFIGLIISFTLLSGDLMNSRQATLLNLEEDDSLLKRVELTVENWRLLDGRYFFGDFGGHFKLGSRSHYSHNILSAWVNYGLLGFCGYAWLLAYPIYKVYLDHGFNNKRLIRYIKFMGFSSLLLVLFSKPVFWEFPAFYLGLYANLKIDK